MTTSINPLNATASDLQAELASSSVTSRQLVKLYLNQIARYNGYLKAVIAVAPEELLDETAARLDEERAKGNVRGPLHGVPILVKDNIATSPEMELPTTCGSLALEGMSLVQNPGGSSSGSAVAVSAGMSPFSIGTETMGSLIMPSDRSALYTIKPTLKKIPQDGIIPVTLEADSADGGYKSAVTGSWGDIRIGYLDPQKWLFPTEIVKYEKDATDQMLRDWNSAYEKLKYVVKVMKPVTLISIDEATEGGKMDIWDAFHTTFGNLLEDYLQSVDNCKVKTLKELIEFNKEHAAQELPPSADNQAGLIRALNAAMEPEQYRQLIDSARNRCGKRGIDKVLEENGVDIILGPGDGPMFIIAGTAGYPVASLPLGYLDYNGRPFGMQITARAHEEALLIQAQSAWEATFPKREPPPLDEIVLSGSSKVLGSD
ncbi:hypothetical protein QQS21_006001 [Conoideocrella luteorostrata]|uniref:Amidase domain-containing protein n=1 Tax=Conoideocrella luteorostrata TaxID=1105319 RepID=A0AAJ0CND1_9HYPO|nr:hypothetical protein QQS21_006001 [Conoideocrella luteorostrata]